MAEDCTVVHFSRDPSQVRIETLKRQGEPLDKFSDCGKFGVFYALCVALSIITYVLDLILAIILLYFYTVNHYGLYFSLTLTFAIIPALFMTTISLRWYIVDHDDPSLSRTSILQWSIRIVFLVLQLSPLLRYIDTLIYGIRSKIAASMSDETKRTILYRRMLDEDTNGALLRLFHTFLHSAPQAIIQLVFLLSQAAHSDRKTMNINLAVLQVWTVLAALMSIAWSLTSYHRSVRYARDDKDKIKWNGLLVAFCWQLMSALSRVLALSLLASVFPLWLCCVCFLHWVVWWMWLALAQHGTPGAPPCGGNRCDEILLSAALGLAYVVAFVAPRDGPTRYVYLAYYLVFFMENTAALVVWCVANNSVENPVLYYGAAGGQVAAFLLAISFLLIYYKYCHPSLVNRSKIPCSDSDYLESEKPSYSKSYNVRTRS